MLSLGGGFGGVYTDKTIHSVEARPQGSAVFDIAGMPLRLLGGVDLYYTRLDGDIYGDKPRHLPKTNNFTVSEWTIGPFITARFSPLDNLSFSAGARFDTAIIKAETMSNVADGDKTFHAFVYDAGITYTPADTVKLYVRYAALFRYPFVDELAQVETSGFNSHLKPEKGFNTEMGTAYQVKDILRFSANFFFMQLVDEIVLIEPITWTFININQDKTRRFGTNIGLNHTPFEWISLDASYSWVYAFFADGDDRNRRVPLVPKHKIYGNLLVHLPFGLSFGPDIEYVSTQFAGGDTSNTEDLINAYFLWGARARFALNKDENKLVFQITAKNLLNKRYAPQIFYNAYYPGDGFLLNASMQYRF
ncbi:MAG: TonB-dependent receptor [Treponema sp.]|nr:TonB-dependent receptor [Treponema sp.]